MTINYIEKGPGLHTAIYAAGHTLVRMDGAWISSDDTAVQTIIDEYVETPDPLTPSQFLYMKALLDVVGLWEQVELKLKELNSPSYPLVYAQRGAKSFQFTRTMQLISSLKPIWSEIDPAQDLSETAVRAAWDQALTAEV